MGGSGCSGRGSTKCYRPKRSGDNVITQDKTHFVCVLARWSVQRSVE